MSKATAIASRHVAYAMKFINDTRDEPTDEAIERELAGCVRPPRPEEYAFIRAEVDAWRTWGMTMAELAELEDETPVWEVTRGHLNRVAGRRITDGELDRVLRALVGGGALDTVTSLAAGVLNDQRV